MLEVLVLNTPSCRDATLVDVGKWYDGEARENAFLGRRIYFQREYNLNRADSKHCTGPSNPRS